MQRDSVTTALSASFRLKAEATLSVLIRGDPATGSADVLSFLIRGDPRDPRRSRDPRWSA
jgi:hypothetical protein